MAAPTAQRLLISQGEASRALGISRLTLINEIERGRLRYVLVGKRRKFKPDDLTSYIERQGRCHGEDHQADTSSSEAGGTTRVSPRVVIGFEEALRLTGVKRRQRGALSVTRPLSTATKPTKPLSAPRTRQSK